MRAIRHHSAWRLIAALAAFAAPAAAQESAYYYPPYVPPAQSSVYNQNSVYLPTPPVATGQDMVRGAGGVTCQSAVGSGGAYVDIGVIGAQDVFNRDTAAVYGRIVVPLGERPDRPDCTKLYELELARMQMELDLMRMGLPDFGAPPASPQDGRDEQRRGAPAMIEPASVETLTPPPTPRPKPVVKAGDEAGYVALLRD